MVPQNKDCIIQPVQTILHSRLGGPEGLKGLRVGEKRRGREQLSISTLGQKLKTLIAWFGLKPKIKGNKGGSNATSIGPFQLQ